MAINDYLPAEQKRAAKAKRSEAAREARRQTVESFITRTFNNLAESQQAERSIAYAIAHKTPFRTGVNGLPPVKSLRDLWRNFVLSLEQPQTGEVTVANVKENEGYKHFAEMLEKQGFKISDLSVNREIVPRAGSYPRISMKIEPQ